MTPYIIFKREDCTYCQKAMDLLTEHGLRYIAYSIDDDVPDFLVGITGKDRPTVPQIFHKGDYIGGYTALAESLLTSSE